MTEQHSAMEQARARARQLRDFYGNLIAYVLVCTMLVIIDLATGSSGRTFLGLDWAYWPILGWGIAVLIHGSSLAFSGHSWEERKAQQLFEKQQRRELGSH